MIDKEARQEQNESGEGGPKRTTLCLAATCTYKDEPAMVCCCDMAGVRDDVMSESADKMRWIEDSHVMLAGDTSAAKELFMLCKHSIAKYKGGAGELAVNELLSSLRAAVGKYRDTVNHAYLYSTYGITFGTFVKQGKHIFSELDHMRIWSELKDRKLNAGLIISSFSDDEAVHIGISSNDGQVAWGDHFVALGTGSRICNTFMLQRDYSDSMSLEECLFRVLEAKVAAQHDPYVGKRTILKVITPKGTYDLNDGYMQSLLELIEVRRIVPYSDLHFEERFLVPARAVDG
jgi:20S proteasome alpha/beta subunit